MIPVEHAEEALRAYGGHIASWTEWDMAQREAERARRTAEARDRARVNAILRGDKVPSDPVPITISP